MKFFTKLRALFKRKPVLAPPAPLYSDADFLEFIAEIARRRTQAEQQASATEGTSAPTQQAA